jgi:CubicO group peptidase (beta-lactamase class C family)
MKYIFLIFTTVLLGQNNTKPEFEKMLSKWQQEHNVPAVGIGIIENGKVFYAKVFGEQRKGVPASDGTLFTVASLTKPIFAITMLKLIDKGELTLDEPLYTHHLDPDLTVDNNLKRLNARYALSHQSGFVNWRNMSPTKKLTFNFEPGSQYLYSGEGYEYLRKAMQNKTGLSLPQVAEEVLFKPLKLTDIAFTWNPEWDMNKVAYPYNKTLEEYDYAPRTELNAAAGLQTTIKDYTAICAYVLNGAGLSKSLFNEMIHPQVMVKENLYYGLGWEVIPSLSNGESVLMHSGDENGIKTMVMLLPKSKKGIVVFTNSDDGFKLYQKIIESYLKEGEEIYSIKNRKLVPTEKYSIPDDDLENYTGTFQIKENVTFEIVKNDGELNLLIRGQSPFKLVAQTEKEFQVDEEISIKFIGEKMNSVIIYQYGVKSYEGKRVN